MPTGFREAADKPMRQLFTPNSLNFQGNSHKRQNPSYDLTYLWNLKKKVVVQLLSCVRLFVTSWTVARQGSLSFAISRSLLKLVSIESVMPTNHLILCHPLLLTSVFPSIFSNESALCIRWPEYWSFSISPSSEYSGLIFFRIDLFEFVSVQGILKNLLQHHNLKALIFWHSVVFVVQLWKNQALSIRTLGKVMYK